MTVLLTACDAHGLAAAGDSWTYRGDDVENANQTKVWSVLDRFLVVTAGSEYILDFDRFDAGLVGGGKFAPDRWNPDKSRDAYLPHHLRAESSIAEIVSRWASLFDPGFVAEVKARPDVEQFHIGATNVLRSVYRDERKLARMVRDKQNGKTILNPGGTHIVSLGYRPDGHGYIYRTDFFLEPFDFTDEVSQVISTDIVPFPSAYAEDVGNETDWWTSRFTSAVDTARETHPAGKALGVATLDSAAHCIDNQPSSKHPYGGRAHGGYVTEHGAVMLEARRETAREAGSAATSGKVADRHRIRWSGYDSP